MALNFPTSPSVNEIYTLDTRRWIWNGSGWARVINEGQAVTVFVLGGPWVTDCIALPIAAINAANGFTLVNYV
jgi:hypothetical protein